MLPAVKWRTLYELFVPVPKVMMPQLLSTKIFSGRAQQQLTWIKIIIKKTARN
jgi:hypothetical protein